MIEKEASEIRKPIKQLELFGYDYNFKFMILLRYYKI